MTQVLDLAPWWGYFNSPFLSTLGLLDLETDTILPSFALDNKQENPDTYIKHIGMSL